MSHDKLHVIAVISNPQGYESRYRLYRQFARYMSFFHKVVLWTTELAIGDQEFAITEADNPHHFQFRTDHILWHKENLINATVKRMPKGCKYIMPCDADVQFADPFFADRIIDTLKHYPVCHPFSEVRDLMPNHTTDGGWSPSYVRLMKEGKYRPGRYREGSVGSPGFAWAFRRSFFLEIGGTPDWAILGSGDFFMASSFFGNVKDTLFKEVGDALPHYQDKMIEYQDRVQRVLSCPENVGLVEGLLLHYWHGRRSERGYRTRNKHLIDHDYQPSRDIRYNEEGILEHTGANFMLEAGIRSYFAGRNEDGLDTSRTLFM